MERKALIGFAVLALMCALPTFAQDVVHVSGGAISVHSNRPVHHSAGREPIPQGSPYLYFNFGPGPYSGSDTNAFSVENGNFLLGDSSGFGYGQALTVNFAPVASGHVSKVVFPIQWYGTGDDTYQWGIQSDSGGQPSGTYLANGGPFSETIPPGYDWPDSAIPPIFTLSPGVAVSANTQYWVVVNTVSGSTTEAIWNASNLVYGTNTGGGWHFTFGSLSPALVVIGN
jgi:hypothetical protein